MKRQVDSGRRPAAGPGSENKEVSLDDMYSKVGSSAKGLTQDEAEKRAGTFGYNEIEEKSISPVRKFLEYFWGPIPWMIEAAVILSALVKDWTDFWIILVLLFTNAVVGFIEEHQADNAVEALKKKLALNARVLRDGEWRTLPSKEVMPGDIIRVRLGDIVPADAVLTDDAILQVDQSALTGESLPVKAGQNSKVFSGAIIRQGESNAIVTATGAKTYFGKTTSLVENAHTVSHFQRAVLKIGNYLIFIALALVALILVVGIYRGEHVLTLLRFSLVLTIAAIPVAMPTVLSITMAVGSRLLSKKQAVVRKLSAIEEMAGIDVLCSDKTGTLTLNQLSLGEPYPAGHFTADALILTASLASRKENEDPIDQAILSRGQALLDKERYSVKNFVPFDPVKKRTEAGITYSDGKTLIVSKGAPQIILGMSAMPEKEKQKVIEKINEFAGKGFRTLGVARKTKDGEWDFMGLLPLSDPPREDSAETIKQAESMGVAIKMVTGDQEAIARETASQLGMKANIMNAGLLSDAGHLSQGQIGDKIEESSIFSEVFPEHKYQIVNVLQQHGHIVGMTGDGVNDAPALKKADAGIAVSGATSAARAASAIVLMTPGLSVIIDAIKEARRIFQRMNSYTIYRITETIRLLLFMTLSILVFRFYPVTALMIVLLALLNDGAIISIAYDRVKGALHPEAWNMPVVFTLSTVLGTIGVIESFGLLYLGEQYFHLSHELLQTLIYLKLSVAGHLTIFVTRTRRNFWTTRPSKALLLAVIITQLIATLISVYGVFMHPLGWKWAGIVWGYCLAWFLIEDTAKLAVYRVVEEGKFLLFSKRKSRKVYNQT
ncbi:MAG TPA: plasma-membrane proton-efflux P-type ATPase [Bacteroidales bacterium]|nr:plasma-membrane proton-efflux P-type ATPase [Bacteroidales bacterium]